MTWRLSAAIAVALSAVPAAAQVGAPTAPSGIAPTVADPRIRADYPVPYGDVDPRSIKAVLDRVLAHVESSTPMQLQGADGRPLAGVADAKLDSRFTPGNYHLVTYEWGVTYQGMLLAGQVTGDARYTRYAADRINFVADVAARYRTLGGGPEHRHVRAMIAPGSLDDSGSMAAAMIKAQRAGLAVPSVRPQIDVWLDWVGSKQFRLKDGTLARERPFASTLWLDDLYMSVPALAQMGALTGERRWFDDAVKQILQFSDRMFVAEDGLYRHGWVQEMDPHPAFYYYRPVHVRAAHGYGPVLLAGAEVMAMLKSGKTPTYSGFGAVTFEP